MRHAPHFEPNQGNARQVPAHLNLLLSYGGWREHAAVKQLPRLLEEAASLIEQTPVHIAIVDLEIPLNRSTSAASPGGPRILQLLRRLDPAPPTIVVRPKQASDREHARGLVASLREGAFAVIDRPLHMETLLETLRRALRRHYQDTWPSGPGQPSMEPGGR